MENIHFTKNFTLHELIKSDTANRRGIDNTPTEEDIVNLENLAVEVLQPIRDKYNKPIRVTSGYRCPELNKAVHGSKTSQHMVGQAADLVDVHGDNKELFCTIKNMVDNGELQVGQLIHEYGTVKKPKWVHVSTPGRKRNEILYFYNK